MRRPRSSEVRRFRSASLAIFEALEPRVLLSSTATLLPACDSGDDGSGDAPSPPADTQPATTDPTDTQPSEPSSSDDDSSGDDSPPESPPPDQPPSPPGEPSRLTVQSPSAVSVYLSWSEPSQDADTFDILRLGPTGGWKTIATVNGDTMHYTDKNLQSGATYAYGIIAENDGGDSDQSSTVVVTLPANADPTLVGQFGRLPGGGAAVPLSFVDTDGTKVKVTMSGPGEGAIHLTAAGYALSLTGTTLSSHVTIATTQTRSATDDGRFDLANLTVGNASNGDDHSALGALSAATTDLAGNFTVAGPADNIRLGNVSDAVVSIGAAAVPSKSPAVSITFAQANDVTLNSAVGIKQLTAQNWLSGEITATTLGTLSITGRAAKKGEARIPGNFAANLSLVGGAGVKTILNKVSIAGEITGGTWQIAGAVNTVAVGSIVNSWTVNVADAFGVAGNIRTLTLSGRNATSSGLMLAANAVGTLTVQGNLSASAITLRKAVNAKQAALGQMVVRGELIGSDIRAAGNVGSVTVGALDHAVLFAGMSPGVEGLPAVGADFVSDASITAIKINGQSLPAGGTALNDSDVAAGVILRVTMPVKASAVGDTDQNQKFGFATLAEDVRNYRGPASAGNYIAGVDSATAL
jgi:hypothetical protein